MKVLLLAVSLGLANVEASQNLAKATKNSKTSTPTFMPSHSPTDPKFPINPFAVMGTTHFAIRGWIYQMEEDCFTAVEDFKNQDKRDTAIATVETLLSMINPHMQHENDGLFIAMDNTFDCVAHNESYRIEHEHDESEQVKLTSFIQKLSNQTLTLAEAHTVCAETFDFASEHEAHLAHEEKVLSPLTSKFPAGSSPSIVRYLIMTNFADVGDYFFPTALTQLIKRNPLMMVGTYVAAIKRILTVQEYNTILPSIMDACGDLWPQIEQGLKGDSGDYTSADDAFLPQGIFDLPTGCDVGRV